MQKQIEFKTSKGTFILVDMPNNRIEEMVCGQYMIDTTSSIHYKLSDITKDEASEIVDEDNDYGVRIFQNYQTTSMQYFDEQITAIESLHSLLKSKGVHLYENPVPEPEIQGGYTPDGDFLGGYDDQWIADYEEASQNTFYNPYIFVKHC